MGLPQDPNPVDGGEIEPQTVDVSEQIKMADEPFTIYVRNNGDDSNTGLDVSEPLQTIDEAFNRVPRLPVENGGGPSVSIELGEGETYTTDGISFTFPWIAKLFLTTENPSGTNAVIECTGNDYGIIYSRSRVYFDSITVRPETAGAGYEDAVEATDSASLITSNGSRFEGGSNSTVAATYNSYARLEGGVTVSGTDGTTEWGVTSYANSHVIASGSLTVENASQGLYGDRGGTIASSCTIDNCGNGIRTQDGGTVKQVGGAVTNCTVAFDPADTGIVKQYQNPDFTGTTDKLPDQVLGTFIDLDSGDHILNGMWRIRSSTVTVPSGGTIRLSSGATPSAGNPFTFWWNYAENGPAADAIVEVQQNRYEEDEDKGRITLEETLGFTDIDVTFVTFEWVGN